MTTLLNSTTWFNGNLCDFAAYCLRCVPHDEDTGGFFVATLRKKPRPADRTGSATSSSSSSASSSTTAGSAEAVVGDTDAVAAVDEAIDMDAINAIANDNNEGDDEGAACGVGAGDDDDESGAHAAKKQKTDSAEDAVGEAAKTAVSRYHKHGLVEFKNWDLESFNKVTYCWVYIYMCVCALWMRVRSRVQWGAVRVKITIPNHHLSTDHR